jgi:hypothetical protein
MAAGRTPDPPFQPAADEGDRNRHSAPDSTKTALRTSHLPAAGWKTPQVPHQPLRISPQLQSSRSRLEPFLPNSNKTSHIPPPRAFTPANRHRSSPLRHLAPAAPSPKPPANSRAPLGQSARPAPHPRRHLLHFAPTFPQSAGNLPAYHGSREATSAVGWKPHPQPNGNAPAAPWKSSRTRPEVPPAAGWRHLRTRLEIFPQ